MFGLFILWVVYTQRRYVEDTLYVWNLEKYFTFLD